MYTEIIKNLRFNQDGLIPVIVQDQDKNILMFAWMNKESVNLTLETKYLHYFSRSRKKLWRKGEESGQIQKLLELRIDCDDDCLLAIIKQTGVACHTGRESCFFKTVKENNIIINQEVKIDPNELYAKD